ncbi:hypothetical protein CERZMDRAFT_97832 [Cercospora zeae-maydis SCOH1-5]|uniref:Uncharacterized protein n=1 Tax=Cercospora zeae-maydis SCOH1-5 TaxID=717836 RepID=A0A6A6FEU9_9PEZI|nr:hypothetical protein CERZMDRAFT_97832 [Cercospora zeae-maydis SCOH1-5]
MALFVGKMQKLGAPALARPIVTDHPVARLPFPRMLARNTGQTTTALALDAPSPTTATTPPITAISRSRDRQQVTGARASIHATRGPSRTAALTSRPTDWERPRPNLLKLSIRALL